jgi:hypothetical protein
MIAEIVFILGLLNNLFLISIFYARRRQRFDVVRSLGVYYLLLSVPAIAGVVLALVEPSPVWYVTFLVIFIVYLGIEALYDRILKLEWRTNWRANWKYQVPYLVLYYASNYGLVVMNWNENLISGILMVVLFALQIVMNILTHPK